MKAIIEGRDGNGKRKSLKVLFLPPVASETFSASELVRRNEENALKKLELSSLSDCSNLQTTDAKCLPPTHQRAVHPCDEPQT